jgi:lipopolysaccharide transport protein LptA
VHDGQADLMRAWGKPARMHNRTDAGEDIRAESSRVEYRGKARRIDLYEDVEFRRDADVFNGAIVRYLLDEQTFTAEGGDSGQVSATIQPVKKEPAR